MFSGIEGKSLVSDGADELEDRERGAADTVVRSAGEATIIGLAGCSALGCGRVVIVELCLVWAGLGWAGLG